MELELQFPPTPEYADQLAELMVPAARKVSGVVLDYSPDSLTAVDGIIEQFRRDGVPAERIASTLFCFGCYVGEVFVRNAGACWRSTEDTSMKDVCTFPLVLELGPDKFCNPIGKVFKRHDMGEVDSLPYFYHVFTKGKEAPFAPPAPPQQPSFWRRLFGGE